MKTPRLAAGEAFQVGEVWQSPRGTLYRVQNREWNNVVLRLGTHGNGRMVRRRWDDVLGWTLQLEDNVETRQ